MDSPDASQLAVAITRGGMPVRSTSINEAAARRLIKGEGRGEDVIHFEKTVVVFFLDAADLFGFPKSIAAIYGICFASVTPLTFANIAERLSISQGSLSQGLRVLKQVGALKVTASRDRREYFAPDMELRKLVAHFISNKLEGQLASGAGRLRLIKATIPRDVEQVSEILEERLEYLCNWHDQASALVPILKALLISPR